MNIFALDESPQRAAQYHNDRHCVKMILESAQLLCTAHHFLDGEQAAQVRIGHLVMRPTHVNHPCAKWARESTGNYIWLHQLMRALLQEYTRRYHKTHSFEELCSKLVYMPLNLPVGNRTPFPQCMPPQYQRSDAVEAYRLYYFGEKQHLAAWKEPATVPDWWDNLRAAQFEKGMVQ